VYIWIDGEYERITTCHQDFGNMVLPRFCQIHSGFQQKLDFILLYVLFFMSFCRSRVVPPLSFSIICKSVLLGVIG